MLKHGDFQNEGLFAVWVQTRKCNKIQLSYQQAPMGCNAQHMCSFLGRPSQGTGSGSLKVQSQYLHAFKALKVPARLKPSRKRTQGCRPALLAVQHRGRRGRWCPAVPAPLVVAHRQQPPPALQRASVSRYMCEFLMLAPCGTRVGASCHHITEKARVG